MNIRDIKTQIEDLEEYRCTLEPFSRAYNLTANEIIKLKDSLPPLSIDYAQLEILVVGFCNLGESNGGIVHDILLAMESEGFHFCEEQFNTIMYNYNN